MQTLKVGSIGTGFAARRRAEALQQDGRARLVSVSSNSPENAGAFCKDYGVDASACARELIDRADIDLVIIATINSEHGALAIAALEAGKHVIVEYPLALDLKEAKTAIESSQKKGKMLHVEHIELLGGLHQAARQYLPEIGEVFCARYVTITPLRPAPQRWTYHHQMFGFPLMAALSRIHRLTDLFGKVISVDCRTRFWDIPESQYYTACFCTARLEFASGPIAQIVYGKGEVFWQACQDFELHGDKGTLVFTGERGSLIRGEENTPIEVGTRKGLFAKDTSLVLDHLLEGKPLYVSPSASLYALEVANAASESFKTGKTIWL